MRAGSARPAASQPSSTPATGESSSPTDYAEVELGRGRPGRDSTELTLHDEADLVGIELPYPILLSVTHDIVDQLVLIDLDGLFVVGIIVTQIATALVVVIDEVYEVNDIIIGEELLELLGDIVADEGHRSGIIISKQFVFYHNIYREGLAQ